MSCVNQVLRSMLPLRLLVIERRYCKCHKPIMSQNVIDFTRDSQIHLIPISIPSDRKNPPENTDSPSHLACLNIPVKKPSQPTKNHKEIFFLSPRTYVILDCTQDIARTTHLQFHMAFHICLQVLRDKTQETLHNNSASRMYLPSLYFSVASYALSYFQPTISLH